MPRPQMLPGFSRVPGRSGAVITPSGERISDRQYKKLVRGTTKSNETIARENFAANPEAALLRPARGRRGSAGLSAEEKANRAQALKDARAVKAENEKRLKEQKAVARKVERGLKSDAKRQKKFSLQKLVSGRAAYREYANTAEEIESLRAQAQKSGKVFSYAWGLKGYDERTGLELTPTIERLTRITVKLDPEEMEILAEEYTAEKVYFILSGFWIHFHFTAEYITYRAAKAGVVVGHPKKRKRK